MVTESIDQLARRLAESLPQGLKSMRDELEQNFRSILQSGLARLDLVTREEFDIQEAVLARTRSKLDDLEGRLAELEAAPARKAGGSTTKSSSRKSAKKPAKKTSGKSAKKPSKKSAKKKKKKAAKKKA